MKQLPIDVQEIIYKKAHKMQFVDCIKDIPIAYGKMKKHQGYKKRFYKSIKRDVPVTFRYMKRRKAEADIEDAYTSLIKNINNLECSERNKEFLLVRVYCLKLEEHRRLEHWIREEEWLTHPYVSGFEDFKLTIISS